MEACSGQGAFSGRYIARRFDLTKPALEGWGAKLEVKSIFANFVADMAA